MIPDYQTAMLPTLAALSDGSVRRAREIRDELARVFNVSDEELGELVPSGQKTLFSDRVSWALTYMKKAGLLLTPKRAHYQITPRGKELLDAKPARIDLTVLARYPDFVEWKERSDAPKPAKPAPVAAPNSTHTPEESLDSAYLALRRTIEGDLLDFVKSMPPAFFEKLVVQLLVAMGYGGSLKDAGQAVGKSGDGGIDGIIKEDKLGLDVIHIQAKRWQNTVGRPEIQSFAGSLDGVKAKKGIFITTSSFSPDARAYVDKIEKRIVLIDGERLAGLMFEHNVGVARVAAYEVKRVDTDYFSEE
ncbi:MAG: restriction endonuclease [Gemmatimonadota bacterium]|nr:restriction endonuclease [Gemmatimonadota bacterium]